MKLTQYGITVSLLVGLGACSGMTSTSSRLGAGHSSQATAPAVSPGMVRQVQSTLRDDGYYRQGAVDGVWGLGTESAVRSFQHDHDLVSDGQLDVPTLQALNLTPGMNSPASTQPMTANSAPADPSQVAPSTGNAVTPNNQPR
jgi:peptidoglycan hydrolase-like protein with peptidoglycan-binding domain